jgi:hypothetical protein
MDDRRAQLLRTAFLVGAVTDALALVPMLWPPMARLLWASRPTTVRYASRWATARP